ncbi:hypothetical protein M2109_004781 [Paenibacillus sp. PastH-3]|nr:hypothetical protein [Paenibacillus sp. PastF-4]MDH6530425.1 hypothetical protein [Paenibacillus sp. PastH-3]
MDIISKVERPRVVGPLIGGWLGSSGNELLPFQVSTCLFDYNYLLPDKGSIRCYYLYG